MKKYAIIGFGGLGKIHLSNLLELSSERGDFKLSAICGCDASSFSKHVKININEVDLSSVDISSCNFYMDYKDMFSKEQLDFVISTLPTYLHEEVSVYALKRGVDVFSEKPMALTLSQCDNMIKAAKESGKYLMIGQNLRFSPAYLKLKEYIENNTFGKPYRAEFHRYSQMPMWTWENWILNPEKSGGCALDMHIHDVDIILWLFGTPRSLQSSVTQQKAELESIFTRYYYDDLLVHSAADWSLPQSFPFESKCMVNFETATVVILNNKLTIYKDEESFAPMLDNESSHKKEMRAFLKLVIDGDESEMISQESTRQSVNVALTEIESAQKNIKIDL